MKSVTNGDDPLKTTAEVYISTLKNVSEDIKNWLTGICQKNELDESSYYAIEELVEKVEILNGMARNRLEIFKPLFLLCKEILPSCFDKNTVRDELINALSSFFDSHGTFPTYFSNIITTIKKIASSDKVFGEKYQQAKAQNCKTHSIMERIDAYMQRTPFEPSLVAEREDIPEETIQRHFLPLLQWGKDIYTAITTIAAQDFVPEELMQYFPRWKLHKNMSLPFLFFAIKKNETKLVENIFEGFSPLETTRLLLEIFHSREYDEDWFWLALNNDFYRNSQKEHIWLSHYKYPKGRHFTLTQKEKALFFLNFTTKYLKELNGRELLSFVQFLFPMLADGEQYNIMTFLEKSFQELPARKKKIFVKLLVSKAVLFSNDELFLAERFMNFTWGILENHAFGILSLYFQTKKDLPIDSIFRKYLNHFWENQGQNIFCAENTEFFFRNLNCIDSYLEENARQAEQAIKTRNEPVLTDLLDELKMAINHDSITQISLKLTRECFNETSANSHGMEIFASTLEEPDDCFLALHKFIAYYFKFPGYFSELLQENPEKKRKICEQCNKLLAGLRRFESTGKTNIEREELNDLYRGAGFFLIKNVSLWRGLKPFFLALRFLKYPQIAKDLSCKNERTIAGFLYSQLKRGIDGDEYKELRHDMANGFAEMLKPIPEKDKGDPKDRLQNYTQEEICSPGFDIKRKEPNALWRYAYVRAIVDLGVNTDGKGHVLQGVMEKVAETDLSEEVQKAAREASHRLRNIRDGYAAGSHQRHLLQAYWWLRRAHLQTLGIDINEKDALKIRVTEYREWGKYSQDPP